MDFGRIPSVDAVDFTLPADHLEGRRDTSAEAPDIRIGMPLWNAKGLVGKLYPRGTRPARQLEEYAEQFATIELNSTFYRDEADQIRDWAHRTPTGFEFCPKLPRAISHDMRLVGPEVDTRTAAFAAAVAELGDRRGPSWLLVPPGFGVRELPALARFVERWAAPLDLCVELREPEWFADHDANRRARELFEAHDVAWIITDTAGRRDAVHMCRTSSTVFVRFSGNDLHASDYARLEAWADRCARWLDSGTERLRFFLHQRTEHMCVELAERFGARLAKRTGRDIATPERYPRRTQGTLF